MKRFPLYYQLNEMDCGPTCLRIISKHFGKSLNPNYIKNNSSYSKTGITFKGLALLADKLGYRSMGVKMPFQSQEEDELDLFNAPLPLIAHWNQSHFVVVYKVSKKHVWIADPASGKYKLKHDRFKKSWLHEGMGIALLLEPSPSFYRNEMEEDNQKTLSMGYWIRYLYPYKNLILQFVFGLLIMSIFQLIFPFLTQAVVDIGIKNQNLNFITLIFIAQIVLYGGQLSVNVIRSWILLHLSTRVNVSILADYLRKLIRLPMYYYDTVMIGDLLQRVDDHKRIESFLTVSSIETIFSFINFFIFGLILLHYNTSIFFVFMVGGFLYVGWILLFLKKRKAIDYKLFDESASNQNLTIELIQGLKEIKLMNSEKKRLNFWISNQAKLFRANIKSLTILQYQTIGATIINQVKDITISFMSAKLVVEGEITLGVKDAKISLERLGEIHQKVEEDRDSDMLEEIVPEEEISIEACSFRYNELDDFVLKDINFKIPKGKVTAIVGMSGSGKTTLVKLLLGLYKVNSGEIKIGGLNINNIKKSAWRDKCGMVLQDGYIFSDTIASNIAESDDEINTDKLLDAAINANIHDYIASLRMKYDSKIGAEHGISQGQKQRILIARAIYILKMN